MQLFDAEQFRQHFPATHVQNSYFDNAASTLTPYCVIEAMNDYYSYNSGSVHRSQHAYATTQAFENVRQQAATFLNASSCREIIWTRGTTEALNLVANSYARQHLKKGDEIVVCETEHHANLLPWLMLAQQTGASIIKVPINKATYLPDIHNIDHYLSDKTVILAIGQMSNVTGGSPDLCYAIQRAHHYGAVVVVDGAQGVVHTPVDVQQMDIDFYAFSGHKLYGPSGIGVLYAKSAHLEHMLPWQWGGGMVDQVSFDTFQSKPYPSRFEAGTPNIAGVIGMGALFNWLAQYDLASAERYTRQLAAQATQQLSQFSGVEFYRAGESSIVSFNLLPHHHDDIAQLLAEQGIAVRAGQHCAQPLISALGINGTVRASFAPYNTQQEVDAFCQAIERTLDILSS